MSRRPVGSSVLGGANVSHSLLYLAAVEGERTFRGKLAALDQLLAIASDPPTDPICSTFEVVVGPTEFARIREF